MPRMGFICLAIVFAIIAAQSYAQEMAVTGTAKLRFLDRMTGNVEDVTMIAHQPATLGRWHVVMKECRYPATNPASEAQVNIVIHRVGQGQAVFEGWLLASSPALSAVDDPRYDIWAISCGVPY